MTSTTTPRIRKGRSTYKGDRELVGVRVPASIHGQLMEIKELTGQNISDQLVDLVSTYATTTLAELKKAPPVSLFEEPHAKSA